MSLDQLLKESFSFSHRNYPLHSWISSKIPLRPQLQSECLSRWHVMLTDIFWHPGWYCCPEFSTCGLRRAFIAEAVLPTLVTKYLSSKWNHPTCSYLEFLKQNLILIETWRKHNGNISSPFPTYYFKWQNYLEPTLFKSLPSSNQGNSSGDQGSLTNHHAPSTYSL